MTTGVGGPPLLSAPPVDEAAGDASFNGGPARGEGASPPGGGRVGSVLITGLWLAQATGGGLSSEGSPGFVLAIALWLWATLLFANFAESLAEGRGKAQAPRRCARASGLW